MKRSINKLLGAAALSLFGLAAQAQDIKLGFNGDLSASPSALSGQAATLGLQAAIDDVNAAGGVLGRKLTLVIRDDLSQPPKSIQNMSDLIDNEKVVAVFGPTNSGNALAWKQVPNQKKIPVIGTVGSGTAITYPVSAGADNYMFRISMVDRDQVVGPDGLCEEEPDRQECRLSVGDDRLRPGRPQGHAGTWRPAGHQAGLQREVRRERHRHDLAAQQVQGRRRRHHRRLGAGHAARAAHAQHGKDQLLPADPHDVGRRQSELLRSGRKDARREADLHAHGDGRADPEAARSSTTALRRR